MRTIPADRRRSADAALGAAPERAAATKSASLGAPISAGAYLFYFLIGAIGDLAVGSAALRAAIAGLLINPDSYMRLVRLCDILSQHAPIHVVIRDGGSAGTVLHWSHLVDSLLLLLMAPLVPFVGEEAALHWAAVAFGPIMAGLFAVAIAWAVAPLTVPRWRWAGPCLAVLSPAIVGFALPGEVHHHIPVAAASAMVAGSALRASRSGNPAGIAMGAWATAAIWLTPESMPFILAAFGGLALYWLASPANIGGGRALRAGGTAFFVLVGAAFLADPPFGGLGQIEIERLSLVYVALGFALCILGWLVYAIDVAQLAPIRRVAAAGLAAAACFGAWFAAFPNLLAGPYGLLDAAETRLFFGVISDMQPIRSIPEILFYLADGAFAATAAVLIAIRKRSWPWAYGAACAMLLLVLGAVHRRFATYPEAVAAAMLPVVLSRLLSIARGGSQGEMPLLRALAVIALFLLAPLAGTTTGAATAPAPASNPTCDPRALSDLLSPYAGETVLTDPADSPAVLYWSRTRTVGSLFHQNVAGFLRLREAWRSPASAAEPEAVRATGASLVLVCKRTGRSLLVADMPSDTLYDRLNEGRPPPWLKRVGSAEGSGYVLYRIAR